jgi:hypothetical protein
LPIKYTDCSPDHGQLSNSPEMGVASLPHKRGSRSPHHGRRSDSPELGVISLLLKLIGRSHDHQKRSDSPESSVASLPLEQTGRSQDHERRSDSPQRTYTHNHETPRVGAIAVPGINAGTESDDISLFDMEEMGTIMAEPFTGEVLTDELREELRREGREELERNAIQGVVVARSHRLNCLCRSEEEPEFWTKKRLFIAGALWPLALLALPIIAAVELCK